MKNIFLDKKEEKKWPFDNERCIADEVRDSLPEREKNKPLFISCPCKKCRPWFC
jgi:hypothetical protein